MAYGIQQEGNPRYFPRSNGSPRTALRGSWRQIYGTAYTRAHRQLTINQPKNWLAARRSAILVPSCDGGASRYRNVSNPPYRTAVINIPGGEGEN